jgi:HK97 family phage portal protein
MSYSLALTRRLETRSPAAPLRKSAPFVFTPWQQNTVQWDITDYQGYAEEGFAANPVIYATVMYKVRAVSYAPLRAYTGSPDAPKLAPVTHPLTVLLDRPNAHQSWMEFQQQQIMYLNLAGNCYTFLDRRPGQALPTALYAMRPDRVKIIPGDKTIKGYYYSPHGMGTRDGIPMLPQNVIHVKYPNPLDPFEGMGYGLSPVSSIAKVTNVDNMVTTFLYTFFKRGGVGLSALKFQGALSDETIARLRNEWMEIYGGYDNWHKPIVLDQSGEYQSMTPPFDELGFELIDARDEYRMTMAFGVDGMLVGARASGTRNTFSNFEQADRGFWQNTMLPELRLFEVDYRYSIQGEDGAWCAFDTSDVPALRADVNVQSQSFGLLVDKGVPPYIAAQTVGLQLERYDGDDVSWLPMSVVPYEQAIAPPAAPPPQLAPGKPDVATPGEVTPELPAATDEGQPKSAIITQRLARLATKREAKKKARAQSIGRWINSIGLTSRAFRPWQ